MIKLFRWAYNSRPILPSYVRLHESVFANMCIAYCSCASSMCLVRAWCMSHDDMQLRSRSGAPMSSHVPSFVRAQRSRIQSITCVRDTHVWPHRVHSRESLVISPSSVLTRVLQKCRRPKKPGGAHMVGAHSDWIGAVYYIATTCQHDRLASFSRLPVGQHPKSAQQPCATRAWAKQQQ